MGMIGPCRIGSHFHLKTSREIRSGQILGRFEDALEVYRKAPRLSEEENDPDEGYFNIALIRRAL